MFRGLESRKNGKDKVYYLMKPISLQFLHDFKLHFDGQQENNRLEPLDLAAYINEEYMLYFHDTRAKNGTLNHVMGVVLKLTRNRHLLHTEHGKDQDVGMFMRGKNRRVIQVYCDRCSTYLGTFMNFKYRLTHRTREVNLWSYPF